MTPEQQRIAIAEVCGWRCEVIGKAWCVHSPDGQIASTGLRCDNNIQSLSDYIRTFYGATNSYYKHPLPDYLNDLNAMHEAEKKLTPNQLSAMDEVLDRLTRQGTHLAETYPWHATAAQRAEAFLHAIIENNENRQIHRSAAKARSKAAGVHE